MPSECGGADFSGIAASGGRWEAVVEGIVEGDAEAVAEGRWPERHGGHRGGRRPTEGSTARREMQRLIACVAAVRYTARSLPRMTQIVRYLEGELLVEALNVSFVPGQSEVQTLDGAAERIRRMRRMAFSPGTAIGDTGASFVSEPTSEYGLNPSSSSNGGDDAGEASKAQGTSKSRPLPHEEHPGEATSRRTRPGGAGLR